MDVIAKFATVVTTSYTFAVSKIMEKSEYDNFTFFFSDNNYIADKYGTSYNSFKKIKILRFGQLYLPCATSNLNTVI